MSYKNYALQFSFNILNDNKPKLIFIVYRGIIIINKFYFAVHALYIAVGNCGKHRKVLISVSSSVN